MVDCNIRKIEIIKKKDSGCKNATGCDIEPYHLLLQPSPQGIPWTPKWTYKNQVSGEMGVGTVTDLHHSLGTLNPALARNRKQRTNPAPNSRSGSRRPAQ